MGGIAVDARGRSSIEGLWAGGEVSSTGAHGANRLASNSLLEAVVYAARIAEDIAGSEISSHSRLPGESPVSRRDVLPALSENNLRAMMTSHVGVIRDGDALAEAVRSFAKLARDAGSLTLRNMATTALLVAASAWTRRESRGAHHRSDHPGENPALAHRTMTTLAAARDVAASLAEHVAPKPAQPNLTVPA
jgi:L-aspartate oxidase